MKMIIYDGQNLKEVIDFVGKYDKFDERFGSWDEYAKYVEEHDNLFKIFYDNGENIEIGPGTTIVKYDNGYVVPVPYKGQKIYFAEEKRPYTVRATDGRFFICTKTYHSRPPSVIYTIVDLKDGIRGTDGYSISPYDYISDEDCKQFLKELQEGAAIEAHNKEIENDPDGIIKDIGAKHVSYKNRIELHITKIR